MLVVVAQVWVDVDHMSDIDEKDWPEEVVSAVVQSSLVICCVTNSFHVPSSPVQEAFLLAIDSKVPGESILGIKLTETCDMRVGAYGLYMDQVKCVRCLQPICTCLVHLARAHRLTRGI